MPKDSPGIEFEKIVAGIQSRLDPNAITTHNEHIVDKLGNKRQFDVLIRGKFAGQELLGIIECKDLAKKVGTPEIDAFSTKSQNINANFKIVVSRKGFSKPAIVEARHLGIQTLSLMPNDESNRHFKVGNHWYADFYYWKEMGADLYFEKEQDEPVNFDPQDLKIGGHRVIDWYTNYLATNHSTEDHVGWTSIIVEFDKAQVIFVNNHESFLCKGIKLSANRYLAKKKKFVGINGDGFFDWQESKVTMPAQKKILSDKVDTNFWEWEDRDTDEFDGNGLVSMHFTAHSMQFAEIENCIDLELL